MQYNSEIDTQKHIDRIGDLIIKIMVELTHRGVNHDFSKLNSPEKEVFDRVTPLLKDLTYGSDEYNKQLENTKDGMKIALDHHYKHNRHHPEYFKEKGIRGMNLVDLIEMLCDWKAATERHSDGDIMKSIEINQKRFGYTDELKEIFKNTIKIIN